MRSVASARDAARPVVHIPVRTRDDEHLSEEQWLAVAERVRIAMGFESCPWAAYLHNNENGRAGQHLHLVLSRVSFNGKIVSDRNDRLRIMEVMRGLERELGLEPVLSGERSRSRGYPRNEEGRAKDRELIMLRAQIDAAGANARTVRGFVERLEVAGVRTYLRISRNGHLQGASFQLGDSKRIWKGSDLGRSYSIGRLVERFDLTQEGELLQAHEVRPRELHRLRALGLEPDRVEPTSSGRLTVAWVLIGNPREQALYQQWIQAALPGRICERSSGGTGSDWIRDVPAAVLEGRRQQIDAAVAGRRPSKLTPVPPLLNEGPQGLREAGHHVERLLERYARELRSGESAQQLSATWLEIVRWTGVRGVRTEALNRRGLGQQLAGLGSIAQTQNAIRSRLLRGERGYVSAPAVCGDITSFPPHLAKATRGPQRREFNRRANQILGERESVALLRVADYLGRSREDRRLRERLEARLTEVERAVELWGGRRSGHAIQPVERVRNAEAAKRYVSRTLGGRLRQAERGLAQGLVHTATALMPQPRLPGLRLLAKAHTLVAAGSKMAGWAQATGRAVLVIEAAVRREKGLASRRDASHLERVAAGDVSTYRLLRLANGHPKAIVSLMRPLGPPPDLPAAIREYRRRRAELIRYVRTSLRQGRPSTEAAPRAALDAARVLASREQVVNAALQKLHIPSLRMLAGTARNRTEVLARFAHGCRAAGMSVGTVIRVVTEVGPVVLGGFLAGAAVTLASRLVVQQVFGLGRDLAKEFLYGERDRSR